MNRYTLLIPWDAKSILTCATIFINKISTCKFNKCKLYEFGNFQLFYPFNFQQSHHHWKKTIIPENINFLLLKIHSVINPPDYFRKDNIFSSEKPRSGHHFYYIRITLSMHVFFGHYGYTWLVLVFKIKHFQVSSLITNNFWRKHGLCQRQIASVVDPVFDKSLSV